MLMHYACLRNNSYKVPQNTEAWPFVLAGNNCLGVARRYAPRERLPLVKSVWFIFHFQKRDSYQMFCPRTAIVVNALCLFENQFI